MTSSALGEEGKKEGEFSILSRENRRTHYQMGEKKTLVKSSGCMLCSLGGKKKEKKRKMRHPIPKIGYQGGGGVEFILRADHGGGRKKKKKEGKRSAPIREKRDKYPEPLDCRPRLVEERRGKRKNEIYCDKVYDRGKGDSISSR